MRPATDDTPRFRGAGLHLVAPDGGLVDRQTTFVWSTGVAADRFRLEVGQGDRVVYRVDVAATRMPMPAALWTLLQPGVDYWWSVTALDPGGQELVASPRRPFSVQRQ